MTEQEFESYASKVDDIADAVSANVDLSAFTLTKEEKALLASLPQDIIDVIERERAKVQGPFGLDVRDAVLYKALAQMMKHTKEYVQAIRLGYDMGGLT